MSLRHGFTTGTAASAAAKAATWHLLTGQNDFQQDTPLPVGTRLQIPILEIEATRQGVMAAVLKDAGDDPDVTHGAIIRALVRHHSIYTLTGGSGVGVVTRPGLPVAVGEAAINPAPREQIRQAVQEAWEAAGLLGPAKVHIEIKVDEGEELAHQTFNPRLGIVGGISILGTRGTVKPFSHAAYQATIRQCLDVMQASGETRPCLTTGGRSERFLRRLLPDIAEQSCVQVADFFAFAMREAARRGFREVLWAVFFGKLVKQAQGNRYTHARSAELDFSVLADWCAQCGMDASTCADVTSANTAMQIQEFLSEHPLAPALYTLLTSRATNFARQFARASHGLRVRYLLFDFSGKLLHDGSEA